MDFTRSTETPEPLTYCSDVIDPQNFQVILGIAERFINLSRVIFMLSF